MCNVHIRVLLAKSEKNELRAQPRKKRKKVSHQEWRERKQIDSIKSRLKLKWTLKLFTCYILSP